MKSNNSPGESIGCEGSSLPGGDEGDISSNRFGIQLAGNFSGLHIQGFASLFGEENLPLFQIDANPLSWQRSMTFMGEQPTDDESDGNEASQLFVGRSRQTYQSAFGFVRSRRLS